MLRIHLLVMHLLVSLLSLADGAATPLNEKLNPNLTATSLAFRAT